MLEVVSALEVHMHSSHIRMAAEMRAEAVEIAGVQQLHGAPEHRILDAFVLGPAQARGIGISSVRPEAHPAVEAVLAGDRELCIAQGEVRFLDVGVAGPGEAGMKLSNPL